MNGEPELLGSRWEHLLPAICWVVFASGLVMQAFSPHLKIAHHSFVVPPGLPLPGKTINPSEIVEKERIVQSISALLTMVGALGLARYYWQRLFGRTSR